MLQAKGYGEIRPGKGAYVAERHSILGETIAGWLERNEGELRSAIEIRTALEPVAAHLMAERSNETGLLQLEELHKNFLAAVEKGNAEEIGRYDEQFHSTIVVGSKNQLLIDINSHICEGMKAFRRKTFMVQRCSANFIMMLDNLRQQKLLRISLRNAEEFCLYPADQIFARCIACNKQMEKSR